MEIPAGRSMVSFPMRSIPAGEYFADLSIYENSRIVEFGSAFLKIHSENQIVDLALDRAEFSVEDSIGGKIDVSGVRLGDKTEVRQWDNYGRLVASTEVPVKVAEGKQSIR